jgi:hypothetical protein
VVPGRFLFLRHIRVIGGVAAICAIIPRKQDLATPTIRLRRKEMIRVEKKSELRKEKEVKKVAREGFRRRKIDQS